MAPAWEELAEEWAGNPDVLVAEVDCTTEEGKALCEIADVEGFPTIKYGDPDTLEDYEGGRDYESLAAFAQENLKCVCSTKNTGCCSEENKMLLDAFMTMPTNELLELIQDQEQKIQEAEEKFEAELEALQNKYQEIGDEKDETIAKVKSSGLTLMKSVIKAKTTLTETTNSEL
jgi:thiol-disulfide isomerase/thioredoxin